MVEIFIPYNPRFCEFYKDSECFVFPRTSGCSIESSRERKFIKPCLMTKREEGRARPMKWKDCPEYQAGCMILDIKKDIERKRVEGEREQVV